MSSITQSNVVQFPSGLPAGQEFPKANDNSESSSKPHTAPDAEPSYGGKHCPPKEDINNVGRIVGTSSDQQPVLEYRRKNYPVEYKRWDNMKQRCRQDGAFLDPRFKRFKDFMSHMSPMRHPDDTVDRIDYNNPEYGPDNCRWASKKLQTANRSNTRDLTDNTGLTLSADEWSTRGPRIPAKTILHRVDVLGYSEHEAVHLSLYARRKSSPASPPTSSDVNVKPADSEAKNGQTYVEFCNENETYNDVRNIPPRIAPMLDLLKQVLADHYETPFFVVEPKHLKMLRDIADLLGQSLDPNTVLACVLKNWGDEYGGFTHYACQRGSFNPPEIPTIQFIRGNINAAGNFYLREQGLLQHYMAGMPQPGLEQKYRDDTNPEEIEYNLKHDFPERFEDDNSFMSPDEWHALEQTI